MKTKHCCNVREDITCVNNLILVYAEKALEASKNFEMWRKYKGYIPEGITEPFDKLYAKVVFYQEWVKTLEKIHDQVHLNER